MIHIRVDEAKLLVLRLSVGARSVKRYLCSTVCICSGRIRGMDLTIQTDDCSASAVVDLRSLRGFRVWVSSEGCAEDGDAHIVITRCDGPNEA
ncbi:hypothetical protein A0H81_12411 [Grifola frondosa]|uniref:Uncharacterized protein n=1 Tax=Grifola frondosa TaxID=5627 RepID=A0A1C7LV39_GRIFR|nr:hypothetical protein A0H81_12411 [Grifola frondosa]